MSGGHDEFGARDGHDESGARDGHDEFGARGEGLIAGLPSRAVGGWVLRPGFAIGVDCVAPNRLQMAAGPIPRPLARSGREKRVTGIWLR